MASSETHRTTALLTSLALLSGCCALAYEILYVRALTTLLGDMLYVHAALLSTFLVGIGLGAKLAHRFVRWLWLFEILTGAYALALPPMLRWLADQTAMAAVTAKPTATIVATIGFLALPSLLIGFSIPLFSAYIKARSAERLAFQGVYIAYNLGALLSILLVEMVLVRALGISRSLAVIGAINVINGIVLLAMRAAPGTVAPPTRHVRFPRSLLVALGLASLASAVFQMFFLKLIYLIFSPHRENFAVGLTVTMLGIFLGAWAASRWRVRFVTFVALVPLCLGLIYALFLPLVRLEAASAGMFAGSELQILIHKLAFGCLFALGPMMLFGATLPALMREEGAVAEESGQLLWISSLANAGGYLAYVMLGHPWLTSDALLVVVAALALSAALLAGGWRLPRPQALLAGAGALAMIVCVVLWHERDFYLAQWLDEIDEQTTVQIFKSGAESATLVDGDSFAWVSYNGHPSIQVHSDGIVTVPEMLSGVIPALAAPRLERALVLGLGTGITAGATSRIFDHTDVVEINNAFYKMMPHLGYANLDIADNLAATRHLSDGRAFLVGREGSYDAIVNSIPAPTYYSASKIYTLEFYERVVRALRPDGVFCTWLAIPNMSERGVETVLAALRTSFRYCDLRVIDDGYYMTTCSAEPIRVRGFDELPVQPVLRAELERGLPGFDLGEFFADIRLSENTFAEFTPDVPQQNTDDHPVLEFMVVRAYQLGQMGADPFLGRQPLMNVDPVREAELADVNRLVRRAAAFYAVDRRFFERNFLPLLHRESGAWEAWDSLQNQDSVPR